MKTMRMMKNLWIIMIFVFLALSCGKVRRVSQKGNLDTSIHESSGAIDFASKDLKGKTVQLSDFRGKPVLVVFWATWCGPCRMEIPDLKELHQQGVTILAVNVQEPLKTVKKFVDHNQLPYRVLLDSMGTLSARFKVNAIPTNLFIDAQGKLAKRVEGYSPNLSKEVLSWIKRAS